MVVACIKYTYFFVIHLLSRPNEMRQSMCVRTSNRHFQCRSMIRRLNIHYKFINFYLHYRLAWSAKRLDMVWAYTVQYNTIQSQKQQKLFPVRLSHCISITHTIQNGPFILSTILSCIFCSKVRWLSFSVWLVCSRMSV